MVSYLIHKGVISMGRLSTKKNKKASEMPIKDVKTARKPLSKKIRFEIFKRDGFKCQYCGKSAPDVVLHVDHINPVSKGGSDDLMNLITSCSDCNLGKKDILLTDNSVIEKQRKQLQELNEKREQLEMMLQWRESLANLDQDLVMVITKKVNELIEPHEVNVNGEKTIKSWLKKFSLEEILNAIDSAFESVFGFGKDKSHEEKSNDFFNLIPKICSVNRMPEIDRELCYIRGILKNRMYVNFGYVMQLMKKATSLGFDVEELKEFAKTARNWTTFKTTLETFIQENENEF